MTYSQAWLEDPAAIRGILVELMVSINGAVDIPIYISNIGYLTEDSITSFNPVITGSLSISESLSIDGGVSMSFGDISVSNPNGDLDIWLDSSYIWTNRSIKVYVGDPRWPLTDISQIDDIFLNVFSGVIAGVDSSSRDTLNIKIRDKLEKLNCPISENKIGNTYYGNTGDTQTNQKEIRPLILGEVFNIEPLIYDPSVLKYMFNDGTSERLIEIRDNGVPLALSTPNAVDLTTGILTLGHPLVGTITVSVQGLKKSINLDTGELEPIYVNNIANIIAVLVTQYGKSSTTFIDKLTYLDIDLPNFAAFAIANPPPVGIFINSKENVLDVCQQLAGSIGAQVYMNRLGKLQLIRLGDRIIPADIISVPSILPPINITDTDILHHSLYISRVTEVAAIKKVAYCTNYTVQEGLQTGIPDEHKKIFETETLSEDNIDEIVARNYRLVTEAEPIPSLLISKIDAENEALRLNNLFKIQHTVYKFKGTSKLMSLILGQEVYLYHSRFGLSEGKVGQVISLAPDWANSTIEVEVFI